MPGRGRLTVEKLTVEKLTVKKLTVDKLPVVEPTVVKTDCHKWAALYMQLVIIRKSIKVYLGIFKYFKQNLNKI